MDKKPVYRPKENALEALFGRSKVVIAVVHVRPLPGSPNYDGQPVEEICQAAIDDAIRYAESGVDGLIVENHGDIPFLKPKYIGPETVAMMAIVAFRVRLATKLPTGVNMLANGAIPAIAVAKASGAGFIRVNEWVNAYVANEGVVEGQAAEATRYRSWLHARNLKILADVHVKHGAHAIVADRSITELTRDAEFFDADVVIATGHRTGDAPSMEELCEIRDATTLPLVAGSGVSIDNVAEIMEVVDGVIVASSLKYDGMWWNSVDPERAKAFMDRVRHLR